MANSAKHAPLTLWCRNCNQHLTELQARFNYGTERPRQSSPQLWSCPHCSSLEVEQLQEVRP